MKSNVLKRVLSFILLITILMISTVSFAAKPQTDNVQWTDIFTIASHLYDRSSWLFKKLEFYAQLGTNTNRYSGITAQLQKLGNDGITWSDVSGRYYSVYEEDNIAELHEENISVSSGTYRFYIEYTAYTTGGLPLEMVPAYSNTVSV